MKQVIKNDHNSVQESYVDERKQSSNTSPTHKKPGYFTKC